MIIMTKNKEIESLINDCGHLIASDEIVKRNHKLYVPFHKKLLAFIEKYDLKQDRGWLFLERNHVILYWDSQWLNNDECRAILQFLIGQKDNDEESKMSYFGNVSLHPKLKPCEDFFDKGNYNSTIFEGAKIFNKTVQEKAKSTNDGTNLMMEVFKPESGVLKLNLQKTDSEKNFQAGMQFLAAGMIQHIRNPNAHEPSHEKPISQVECLELLNFLSYLFKQVDNAVFVPKA
jgi:uncharacterized protein (TIGR02391 family)